MSKAEAEQYNGEAFNQIWGQIDGFPFEPTDRNRLVGAYISIMLEHHRAIRALLDEGYPGSAFTLLRSQGQLDW